MFHQKSILIYLLFLLLTGASACKSKAVQYRENIEVRYSKADDYRLVPDKKNNPISIVNIEEPTIFIIDSKAAFHQQDTKKQDKLKPTSSAKPSVKRLKKIVKSNPLSSHHTNGEGGNKWVTMLVLALIFCFLSWIFINFLGVLGIFFGFVFGLAAVICFFMSIGMLLF